jgi:tripartite-type tricarboxylate transporter receptor subunit TctC
VTGSKRSSLMPDVPTLAESGVPGYNFETWFIAFVPAGTPKDIVEKLNATLNKTLNTPALKDRMVKEGFDPTPGTPQQAQDKLKSEMDTWAKLVKARGITAD